MVSPSSDPQPHKPAVSLASVLTGSLLWKLVGAVALGVFTNFLYEQLKSDGSRRGGVAIVGSLLVTALLVLALRTLNQLLPAHEPPARRLLTRFLSSPAGAAVAGAGVGLGAMAVAVIPLVPSRRLYTLDQFGYFHNYEMLAYAIFVALAILFARVQSDWLSVSIFGVSSAVAAVVALMVHDSNANTFADSITGYLLMSMLAMNALVIAWAMRLPQRVAGAALSPR